jgi:hypothetical protein
MGKRAHDPSDATIQQTVEEFIEEAENTSVSRMILDLSCSSGPHIPKNLRYALSKLPNIALVMAMTTCFQSDVRFIPLTLPSQTKPDIFCS